jgi:hypothetical protein
MPGNDRTGPVVGSGRGGRGRMLGGGPGGPRECTCPNCKLSAPHKRGVPCNEVLCPKCHKPMTRGDEI